MRKTPAVLLLSLALPALLALPVLSPPSASPRPVTPEVQGVSVEGVDTAALQSNAGAASKEASAEARAGVTVAAERGRVPTRPAVFTDARDAERFELLGVTWRSGTEADLTVLVRVHGDDGWSDWTALDVAPTPSRRADGDLARAGTEPLYTGPADGYQLRIDVRAGSLPDDIRVDLVDPGASRADARVGTGQPIDTAVAVTGQPRIFSRAEWGADERLRGTGPIYNATIKAGFVHHTAGANGYPAADVPRILRSIYAYHTKANGWSDIGYNFLVDRFGRIWEGRFGGTTRPVVGAHTGGFNKDTFGVSAIGDYGKAAAPPEMIDSIARVMAWKLSLHFRDPFGTTKLVSQGGGTSRYARGSTTTVNVISGHRDVGNTSCPGANIYAQLATIRSRVNDYMGPSLVNPTATPAAAAYGGAPIVFSTWALRDQSLRLDIRERCGGRLIRTLTGSAAPGAPSSLAWDLTNFEQSPAKPGTYDVSLTSSSAEGEARTWTSSVTIEANETSAAAGVLPVPCDSAFVPLAPTRLYDSRKAKAPLGARGQVDLTVAGRAGVPSTGAVAVALNVVAVRPTKRTFLTVFPTRGRRPNAYSLNLAAGATRAAHVVAATGLGGKVSVGNYRGSTNVIVNVVGYYVFPAGSGQLYHPTQPFRLYDSRKDVAGMLGHNAARTMTLPTLGGVAPEQMTNAVINVTALGSTGKGYVTAHPAGTPRPALSTLNFESAAAVANRAAVRLSGGALAVTNRGAPTHVVVEVVGFYAEASVPGGTFYRARTAMRVLDTRRGKGAPRAPLTRGGRLALVVAGPGKAAPTDAKAVVMTLTSTGATAATFLTAWPANTPIPGVADVSVRRRHTTSNLIVVPVGLDGAINVFNRSGSTHVVGDVVGYFR